LSKAGLFFQNIIAIVWDFDNTLSSHYMQEPLFRAYDIDSRRFWDEVDKLPRYYARAGVTVPRDSCYLGHLLSYVKHGRIPDLTNAKLRELGAQIRFFPGIPELFRRLKSLLEESPFAESDLHLESYIVSTGLAEMIRGSAVAPHIDGIWASEFIETPAAPGADLDATPEPGVISQIAGFLDHTTKTRALFEINKGVNKHGDISVNDTIPEDERRVPFKNMIYIADGPSDIPSFSVVRQHGGLAYAVYPRGSPKRFAQVNQLLETGRVNGIGPADYREDDQTDMWLQLQVKTLAWRIVDDREHDLQAKVGRAPSHLDESSD